MMTPKEKAEELCYKITLELPAKNGYLYAKECALIAVNEILDLGYVPNEKSSFNVYKFYQEVKQEIEKL